MDLFTNDTKKEQVLLVCLDTGDFDAISSTEELKELTYTSGAEVVAVKIQKRQTPETATCIGSGMVIEVKEFCENNDIDLIIFDRELSPTQIRNLERDTGVRVIDRTMLILDIFADRARSKEGKLQVELAQLKYMLPRLTGRGIEMSRLGGGIGTRGPGETKLETDKRHIRRKIEYLKADLREAEKNRGEVERRRKKDGTVTVALVGYTNAGKSSIMNKLTDAGVLAEDKLFATLDPTARALKLPCGKTVMLIDTVGLIRRLPHNLIESFKSTLEQAAYADIILNVCDISNPEADEHIEVTEKLLTELGRGEEAMICVLNKWDRVENDDIIVNVKNSVKLSAITGYGIEDLLNAIEENLPNKNVKVKLLFPFSKVGLAAEIRKDGVIYKEEYVEKGLEIEALVEYTLYNKIKEFEHE